MNIAAPRRTIANQSVNLESLESRQLLAADLDVQWKYNDFRLPAILVPGDHFDPAGGAARLEAPITITNNGPQAARGLARIDFYLSTDTTLDPGRAILIQTLRARQISLGTYSADPSQFTTISPDMTIPPTIAPGTYYLIVKVLASAAINDSAVGNNIAVDLAPITVARRFGSFAGRVGVAMTLQDADGTKVTFKQTGGGYGDVVQNSSSASPPAAAMAATTSPPSPSAALSARSAPPKAASSARSPPPPASAP
jgi:hypothetical protein